ncbi:hypothetical protein [Plantactinospora soyae]|uniref:Uncharacterized protein n=1 Tax=Plantactinospora soyae TaxID=1544732 RepID=A0A927M8K2_9ACTN|nr:hypothetical protein [Plantactinospora soyae]MBE1486445.1 hypothetical protein [Plantactinospora soyae]
MYPGVATHPTADRDRPPVRPYRAAPHQAAVRPVLGVLLLVGALLLTACGGGTPAPAATPTEPAASRPAEARDQLAALAAAAQDRRLVAGYTLSAQGQPDRTISVTRATDGSWRVDIPGGALGGTADVSMAQTSAGTFQCALSSAGQPGSPGCVRVADPGEPLDAGIDPRMQHPFTDWPEVLTDRQAPLSISTSALPGAQGACFAVESTSASVSPPLDSGIYCYAPDGTLTAARLPAGTLTLTGTPTAAPATVALSGPLVDREPLRIAAPPPGEQTGSDGEGGPEGDGGPDGGTPDDPASPNE